MIGTLEGYRAYHTARGNSLPTDAQSATATASLVRGSDYIRAKYDLLVAETDERVTNAAYVAAGRELALVDGSAVLVPMPGFWVTLETGKVLTRAEGTAEWTLKEPGMNTSDAMSVKEYIRGLLRGAINPGTHIMVV